MVTIDLEKIRAMVIATILVSVAGGVATSGAMAMEPPQRIKTQGKIVFCTDLSYPPWEEVDTKTLQPAGVDIDVGTAIANAMGVKSETKNITFDGLIPALQAGQCDAIISTMIDKPERRQVVDFVDYTNQGNCLIVLASKDLFFSALVDVSGKRVAVQSSTIAEEDLTKANGQLQSEGKPPMLIVALPNNTDAIQQLSAGLVDTYYGVPEQAHYLNEQRPGSVKIASPTMSARPAGIATLKKDHDLHDAIDAAFKAIQANGQYDAIFSKAGVQSLELKD